MNKWVPTTLLLLLAITSTYADYVSNDSFDTAIAISSQRKAKQAAAAKRPMTYNAGPKVKQGYDFFLSGEALYFKTMLSGYAYTSTGVVNPNTVPTVGVAVLPESYGPLTLADIKPEQGTTYFPPDSMNPGFKVALGSMLHHGGWDISAEYFWLYSSDEHHATATRKNPFLTTASNPVWNTLINFYHNNGYYPTDVKFGWNSRYQMVSLVLGRNYFTSRYLKLRPFIGLRGTWQTKHLNLDYGYPVVPRVDFDSPAPNYTDPPYTLSTRHLNKQWGLGILTGLDSAWQFSDNFSIYGKASVSELWFTQTATFRMDTAYIGYPTTGFESPQDLNYLYPLTKANIGYTEGREQSIQPMFDAEIGLRLETYFSDFNYHILLQVGWETQYWPNQLLLLQSAATTPVYSVMKADFSMHGVTAKLRFDF